MLLTKQFVLDISRIESTRPFIFSSLICLPFTHHFPQFACMNFINVVVHTTEDLNYRVYLQHEFSLLGIDEYLEDLEARSRDFPNLTRQIKAYQDNYFNVDILVGFVMLLCTSGPHSAPMYNMCVTIYKYLST